jgi:hypothetical protein
MKLYEKNKIYLSKNQNEKSNNKAFVFPWRNRLLELSNHGTVCFSQTLSYSMSEEVGRYFIERDADSGNNFLTAPCLTYF